MVAGHRWGLNGSRLGGLGFTLHSKVKRVVSKPERDSVHSIVGLTMGQRHGEARGQGVAFLWWKEKGLD